VDGSNYFMNDTAKSEGGLKHPNIVSLLGVAASAEEIVLILNFISGNNLDMLIFGKERLLSTVCRHNTSIKYVAV